MPMACRYAWASRPVKRTTIASVRSCLANYDRGRCCWPIADMTPTGSENSPSRKEHGQTFLRSGTVEGQSASALTFTERNLVERFFNKIKQRRRIATRYDKHAANYLAFVKLASIRL